MQTETLRLREKSGQFSGSREALGIHVYQVTGENHHQSGVELTKRLNSSQMQYCEDSGVYLYQREISKRFDLTPGSYVIIPSCFKKDVAMKFHLRVFIEGEEERELTFYDVNKNELVANNHILDKYSNWNDADEHSIDYEDNVHPNPYENINYNFDNQVDSHDNELYREDNEVRYFSDRRANTQVTSKACSIL
jgi:hypothetical protein